MYTGSIELNIEDKHDYFDLVKAANELALIELVEYIQEYMIQNEKPWMLENFVQLFQKISTYDSMHKLQTYCADLGTCHRRDYEREIVGFHNFTIDDFE
ncbi:11683_t:CDS:2, partial [Entrophospora sp. SA101]